LSPGIEDIREFVTELLCTIIRKGPVPSSLKDDVLPGALDETVPEALKQITGGDSERLAAYPFEPDALQEFLESVAGGAGSNKPSEILGRLQRASLRAMRMNQHTIDARAVAATQEGGL
jgi:hypothetical protein